MSDGFGCGDASARFELFEIVAQLILFLKLKLLVFDLLVKVFQAFDIEPFLNIHLKRLMQELSQVLIFKLRKGDVLVFHEVDEFSFSGALPRGGSCEHFVGHDTNGINIRFVGVDIFDETFQRHIKWSANIEITLVKLLFDLAAKSKINNFPSVIFPDDILRF
jgi:hypothetical protein